MRSLAYVTGIGEELQLMPLLGHLFLPQELLAARIQLGEFAA